MHCPLVCHKLPARQQTGAVKVPPSWCILLAMAIWRTIRLCLVFLLVGGHASAEVIALTRATVIDGTGAAPRQNITIVMENGRIRGLGPNLRPPDGATVVDLSGKYVVPGIINAHGHVGENRDPQLRQYALYGVTTTTSISIDPADIAQFKAEQKRGNLRGAPTLT